MRGFEGRLTWEKRKKFRIRCELNKFNSFAEKSDKALDGISIRKEKKKAVFIRLKVWVQFQEFGNSRLPTVVSASGWAGSD